MSTTISIQLGTAVIDRFKWVRKNIYKIDEERPRHFSLTYMVEMVCKDFAHYVDNELKPKYALGKINSVKDIGNDGDTGD